ncbi:MAG: AraC family transcriptional regulator [Bacteroidota bacterium]
MEGAYRTHSDSNQIELDKKDGVVKRCGTYISELLETSVSSKCEAIAVYFYEDILKEIYNEAPDLFNKRKSENIIQKVSGNELIDKYIESLIFYFENPVLADDPLVTLKLKEIIMLLLKTDKYPSVLELITDLFNPKSASLKQVVERHLHADLSMDELAHLCGMSLSSFKREFKKVFNETPARYIKAKKLERAAKLLSVSGQSVAEIAYECGFNNPDGFSTIFTQHFGLSPKKYRMNQIKSS